MLLLEVRLMSSTEAIQILGILVWPIVAIVALLVIRPHLSTLLARSKVKLSLFGQSIEMTLPEIAQFIEEQAEGKLTEEDIRYLEALSSEGSKNYPEGIDSATRQFLRPMRNFGLIVTIPRNAFLGHARGIELSVLGRLYLRARNGPK
jgi:hypothetical protein